MSNGRSAEGSVGVQSVDRALTILTVLARLGEAGVSEVAGELGVHKSTAFRLVAVLGDLTDDGQAALEALRRERESLFERVTAGWDAADLAALTTLFGRLLEDLSTTLPGNDACGPTDAPREIR